MSKEKKETALAETTVTAPAEKTEGRDTSVESFITQAIASNASPETLQQLFALHKEVKAEQARSAFTIALSEFQKDCPEIKKTKKVLNKDGRTVRYQFAPLDAIIDQIKSPLAEHGLSYAWDVRYSKEDGMLTATCTITHIMGHSKDSSFSVPIDTEGYMTAPQKHASAQTFAKRYALCNALGISTGDEDTDATDVHADKDAKSVKAKIVLRLKKLGYETTDKVIIEETVKKLTQLDLVEKNYEEIASRLDTIVTEKEEYENSEIQ